jgi:hypothetical protein
MVAISHPRFHTNSQSQLGGRDPHSFDTMIPHYSASVLRQGSPRGMVPTPTHAPNSKLFGRGITEWYCVPEHHVDQINNLFQSEGSKNHVNDSFHPPSHRSGDRFIAVLAIFNLMVSSQPVSNNFFTRDGLIFTTQPRVMAQRESLNHVH